MVKLKQLERKMHLKIENTRLEAERVLKIKEQNNQRVQEKMNSLAEHQLRLDQKREEIKKEKLFHKEQLFDANQRR